MTEGPTGVDFFAQRYLALLAERDALASELAGLREGVVPVPIMDAIEARADAATPGPWADVCMGSEGYFILESEPSTGTKRRRRVSMCIHEAWEIDKANAEFIAHAREDVPALVAEVRRLASELAAARGGTYRGWSWDDVERHVSRLVVERDHAEDERDAARREAEQARAELAGVRVELERTEGDWAVAIREATRARAALCRHGKTGPHEHGVSGLGLSKIQCPGPATAESTDGC